MNNVYLKYFSISLLVVIVDQAVKLAVHEYMTLGVQGQINVIGDIFKLHYLTNSGMAFGVQLNFDYGKLFLSLFRIGAMILIGYYLYTLIKQGALRGLIICIALILGGAIGNLIDSIFYGVWLNNASHNALTPWFHGQVIDMFYIDIWEGQLPDWMPLMGEKYMALWPVFNIADATIFVSVCILLIFQKRYFKKNK